MGWSWAQRAAVSMVVVAGGGALSTVGAAPARADDASVPIVVQTAPGLAGSVASAIEALGGTTGRRLRIIDSFAAEIPQSVATAVAALPGVVAVSPDRTVRLLGDDSLAGENDSEGSMPVSMASTIDATGASAYRSAGLDGAGIDVALIDSGVSLVPGLDEPGRVVDGPDFTREGADPVTAHRDLFGHGTHMAGIIAGADRRAIDGFSGVAPAAGLVNVKVADRTGRSSTSQVIAAIGWVVSHQQASGFNIRVLNLSFSSDGGAEPALDPLDQAVEAAWRHGITVVVAAGNHGATSGHLSNPARDPHVLAVGASDSASRIPDNDVTLDFSSRGDGTRNPDLIAPGRSVASLRDPSSFVDTTYPSARVGDDLFRGSGTSQAAAVVSAAVALVLEQHPDASPDQVKALLNATAAPIANGGDATAQGHGVLNLFGAMDAVLPSPADPMLDDPMPDAPMPDAPMPDAPMPDAPMPDDTAAAVATGGRSVRRDVTRDRNVSLAGGIVIVHVDTVAGRSRVELHAEEPDGGDLNADDLNPDDLNPDDLNGGFDGSSWSGSSWS